MKTPKPRCNCLHCKELFVPDYRNGSRQRFCSKPECRKASRRQLIQAGLIAYDKPLYQVLSLEPASATRAGALSVAEVLRKVMGGQP